ncbi:hypothetical protein K438DRAFT_722407 [Mycena galopus ATCC 62051]|nr:hypothetical protein K438DRAFT_722407 [Mycena galopus ATCC 62051]
MPRPGGVKFRADCKVGRGDMRVLVHDHAPHHRQHHAITIHLIFSTDWDARSGNSESAKVNVIVPATQELIWYFLVHCKLLGQCTSCCAPPPSMSRTVNAITPPRRQKTPQRPKVSKQQEDKRKESRRAASARYCDRNRQVVLQAGRERAARCRAHLRMLEAGNPSLESARACAREASARYRAQNREALTLKQHLVRKHAYIRKHGIYAHIQRRFDAPIHRDLESDGGEDDDDDAWGFGRPDPNYVAPRICDYEDPFLR